MFFYPLTFNLKVSLGLKWVSCKQHIDGSCFLIHSVTLCLLIGALSPLTFRLSTERNEFTAIMMLVEYLGVSGGVLWSFLIFVAFGIYLSVCVCVFFFHLFSPQKVLLKIYCRAGLVVTNSFNFCLSGKHFVSLSVLNDSLAG